MSRYYMDAMEPKKEFLRRRGEVLGGGDEMFAVCEIGETVVVEEGQQQHQQHDTTTGTTTTTPEQ